MCSSLEIIVGMGTSSGDVSEICLCVIFDLVERTPFFDWTMCPFMFSSADGQYFVALARVSLVQKR